MGLEMELDYEKKSSVGLSPNTVLPSKHDFSYTKKRSTKERSSRRDELLILKEDFREISFSRYHRSISCKNVPSTKRFSRECDADLRRGSIYQTSREVRRMKEMGIPEEGRRKIEISRSSDISFSIVDTLCRSDEEKLRQRRPSKGSTCNSKSLFPKSIDKASSSDTFFEICLDPSSRGNGNSDKDSNSRNDHAVGPPASNGNELLERDVAKALNESVSAKVEKPPLMTNSKTRFSPVRKIFDPFAKSKSLKSPLSYSVEPGEIKSTGLTKNMRKSVVPEFLESKSHSFVSSSPVHLQGYLKLESRQGLPFFEFSLQQRPEDVFVAKTRKAKGEFNWVYTFHAVGTEKKSTASSGPGFFDNKDCSSTVGQMQVSCRLSLELLNDGVFQKSTVTEFVLYDIAHSRLSSVSSQENSKCANDGELVPPGNLNPSLEIAAIVMQAPFEKRESLKHKRGDDKLTHENLLKLSIVEPKTATSGKVKVVIPVGNHGLPSSKCGPGSPSSLLERWNLGGGCDCGGWDMGCPLTVLGNPHFRCGNSQSIMENKIPMELFLQGTKDDTPAFTMAFVEEGLYAVDFHAHLSTLQAFSVCVAILHGTEASSDSAEERRDPRLLASPQGNSLKTLIDDEVKFLIETVTTAEKMNTATKRAPQSYVINPPFSPIARV